MTKRTYSERELRAIAFGIADEIETAAQHYIARGYSRKAALALAVKQLAGA